MAKNAYIGVSGVARKVKQPYIGVSSVARRVKNGYIGVSGVARQFFAGGTPMSDLATGSSVYLNENGSPVEYLVVHQGLPSSIYDESCDGVWLLRKDILMKKYRGGSYAGFPQSNLYEVSGGSLLGLLDADIVSAIKTVKIPYWYVNENTLETGVRSGSDGLECKAFSLSAVELGITDSRAPSDGAQLPYFNSDEKRIALYDGSAYNYHTRSGSTSVRTQGLVISESGQINTTGLTYDRGYRPAMIMPNTLLVNDEGIIITE